MNTKQPVKAAAARGATWEGLGELLRTAAGLLPLAVGPLLLSPEAFGVAVAALLVIAAADALSQTGFRQAVIQRADVDDALIDTAWTLLLLRGVLLAALCALAAPVLAGFFPDAPPELAPMIAVSAVVLLLTSAQGAGTFLLARRLEFRRLQWVNTVPALLAAAVTVTGLVIWRSPWAYVWGRLVGAVVETVLSHGIAPRRLRLRIDRAAVAELVRFGRWIFLLGMVLFLMRTGDEPLVGRWLGLAAMGMYKLAFDLSQLPVDRVVRVIARVAMPAFARLQDDVAGCEELLRQSIRVAALLALPASALVAVIAPDLVALLRPDYAPVAPLARLLCLGVLARTVTAVAGAFFQGVGRPELDFVAKSLHLVVLFAPLYFVAQRWQLPGVAGLATLAMAAPLIPCLLWLRSLSGLRPGGVVVAMGPGAAAAVVVGGSAAGLRLLVPDGWLGAGLAVAGALVITAAVVAGLSRLGIWSLRGELRALRSQGRPPPRPSGSG